MPLKPFHILLLLFTIITLKSSVFAGTAFCMYEHTSTYGSDLFKAKIAGYMCNLDLDIKGDRVNDIGGNHENNEKDTQVDIVRVLPDFHSYLTIFPDTFCKKFKNLEIIDMCSTKISTIEPNSLEKCKNLKILQFYLNEIMEVPENLLKENSKLSKLFITYNHVQSFPEKFLSGLAKLEVLDFSFNKLNSLHENIFRDLVSLKELNLEENKLEILKPNLFQHLRNLEILNLNDNKISELAPKIFSKLLQLKELSLKGNTLTVIHSNSFPESAKIDKIVLTKNNINAIDENFIKNCGISELKMGKNDCVDAPTIKKSQMKSKLKNCYKNYNELLILPTTTTTEEPTTLQEIVTARIDSTTKEVELETTTYSLRRSPRLNHTTTTTKAPVSGRIIASNEPCGVAKVLVPNIIKGVDITKGTHPWIAALIDKSEGYFCGGTLVSNRKVVTAAHCILGKNGHKKEAEDLFVLLGVHYINNTREIGREAFNVERIVIHENWNPMVQKFDADIAVLKLDKDVKFSSYIQPVCIAKYSLSLKNFKNGIVVGFGRSENSATHENKPKKASFPIKKSIKCYEEFPSLLNIASHRTLCGGHANGTGSCTGDSGGGLTVEQNGVHYFRGIISASLHDSEYGCDVKSYSICTDVRYFIKFINDS